MNTGQVDRQCRTESDEQIDLVKANHDKLNHDIRASLAITNGFNQALESSFSELCDSFQQLQRSDNTSATPNTELKYRIEQLEADCRFCLSRIERSLKQLETRIESDSRLNSDNTAMDRVHKS